ncbi:MAG: ORF6N domain-containing protein [Bacteroidales bacterium]|nr:ORF6N domain-containing protein [Bacteroidales bacterium]
MAKKETVVVSDEPVADSNQLPQVSAENKIFTIRGIQVIVDRDLAEFYGVETKRLNQQANRNRNRFPQRFRFQLSKEEKDELVANCNRFEPLKHSSTRPYAYTEQGVPFPPVPG